jgi:hypothetical protein
MPLELYSMYRHLSYKKRGKEKVMKNITVKTEKIKNLEMPFTELFSFLKKYEILSHGFPTLAYGTDELKVMHQHIDNAMTVLLQGLQDLGHVSGIVGNKKIIKSLSHIGFFISAISNLTEALNTLRSDTSYTLQIRKK